MKLTREDIEAMNRVERLKIINGISGIKPGNLVGTISEKFGSNLAIISSVVHLGSNPPLLGFIMRPTGDVSRNTILNIRENGCFTINHIHQDFIDNAHYTSVKFDHGVSEFEMCRLTEQFIDDFPAPFVKESRLKIGLKLIEEIPIKANGTIMVVGEIEILEIDENCIDKNGYIRLDLLEDIGIGGLNDYYKLIKIKSLPYARINEVPKFE